MRKTMTRMGLGLALIVGAAGAAAAQGTRPDARPDSARRERGDMKGERGMQRGGPGGRDGALLRGITLTDAQKTRLQELRKAQAPEMKKTREQFGAVMKEARDARQRGDTATARAKMAQVRTAMDAQRAQHIASLRTVLTADQQKQLDANIAAVKERPVRGDSGARGDHRQHRGRPGRTGTGR